MKEFLKEEQKQNRVLNFWKGEKYSLYLEITMENHLNS